MNKSEPIQLVLMQGDHGEAWLQAGTADQLKHSLGLAVATLHQSVAPGLYQSPEDAMRRARICRAALIDHGEFDL